MTARPERASSRVRPEVALEQALQELAEAHAELARRQSFTEALLETIEVGIVSCDAEGRFVVSNRAERVMFGLESGLEGLLPEHLPALIDVLNEDGRPLTAPEYPLMRTLRGDTESSYNVFVGPVGAPHREVVVRGSQIRSPDGELLGAVAALSDVTAERTASRALVVAERAAQEANTFFHAVLTATPDYIQVTDLASGAIVYGSPGKEVLGMPAAELQTLGPGALEALVHSEDQQSVRDLHTAAASLADGQSLQLRYRARHAEAGWRWLSQSLTPFRRSPAGDVVEVLAVLRDITDLVRVEERLTYAAQHDVLTGLPNRTMLVEVLDAALRRSAREGREVAVLFCDLDGFKHVNDTGGHAAGDAVLCETATRLRSVLRREDTVARVGGDEFVIVVDPWNRLAGGLPDGGSDRRLALHVAERVAAVVRQPINVKGVEHVVTASIGITYASLDQLPELTAEDVLHEADAAMYVAKDAGKDRFELYAPTAADRSRPSSVVG